MDMYQYLYQEYFLVLSSCIKFMIPEHIVIFYLDSTVFLK